VLSEHRRDIAKFFPASSWTGGEDDREAFLVTPGDETVGVVVVQDAGDGAAQMELDDATPRFRDFAPGEFVYRRRGLFRDRGFHQVLTPPDLLQPYYGQLGCTREGASCALDVA